MANGHPFFNAATIGLSNAAAQRLTGDVKRRWGPLGYPLTMIDAWRATHPFGASIDADGDRRRRASIQIVVGNGRHHGAGMTVAASARIDDHRFHFYSLDPQPWWQVLRHLPDLRDGTDCDTAALWRGSARRRGRRDRPAAAGANRRRAHHLHPLHLRDPARCGHRARARGSAGTMTRRLDFQTPYAPSWRTPMRNILPAALDVVAGLALPAGPHAQTVVTAADSAATAPQSGPIAGATPDKLMDRDIVDITGADVGSIDDVVIDSHGDPSLLMVDVGGILGIGGRTVALDPSTITAEQGGDLVTSLTRQQIEALPAYVHDGNTGSSLADRGPPPIAVCWPAEGRRRSPPGCGAGILTMAMIEAAIADLIGTITLANDQRHNVLGHAMVGEIVAALHAFHEAKARVVILRARTRRPRVLGRARCRRAARARRDPLGWDDPLRQLVREIETFPAPSSPWSRAASGAGPPRPCSPATSSSPPTPSPSPSPRPSSGCPTMSAAP